MKKWISLRTLAEAAIVTVLCIALFAGGLYGYYTYLAPGVPTKALENPSDYESEGIIYSQEKGVSLSTEELRRLYCMSYVLYRELAESTGGTGNLEGGRMELFFDSDIPGDCSDYLESKEQEEYFREWVYKVRANKYQKLLDFKENWMQDRSTRYTYCFRNTKLSYPETETNSIFPDPESNGEYYALWFTISYDDNGYPRIETQSEELLRQMSYVLLEDQDVLWDSLADVQELQEQFPRMPQELAKQAVRLKSPKNCSVTFGLPHGTVEGLERNGYEVWNEYFSTYISSPTRLLGAGLLLLAFVLGAYGMNPESEEKRGRKVLPRAFLEVVFLLGCIALAVWDQMPYDVNEALIRGRISWEDGDALARAGSMFLLAWYVGACLGETQRLGLKGYLKKRCILCRIALWLRGKFKQCIRYYKETDLGQDLHWKLIGLLAANALLIMVFCCVWFVGILGVCIYSVVLYFLAMRWIDKTRKDYGKLCAMTGAMADGDLNCSMEGELGLFRSAGENLVKIRDGFEKAVKEEVKSQRMKTELITNVSHDLKTPLTAIITYVNLLKEDPTPEDRARYIETLERKSLRLKSLIEDLFEVSKANSGNVELKLQECDLANLLRQVAFEMEDKLKEKNLVLRMSLPEEKVLWQLDSEKTYRIYENLFGNIAKYALEGTRVYVTLTSQEGRPVVTLKNITAQELSISPQELTERFVRGDASRGTTEGSGLGLAIARSFTELQGGRMIVELDGDLFKVTTTW